MARIPILFTQLQNLTQHRVRFRVDGTHFLLPDLPRGENRMVKLYRIIRLRRRPVKKIWVFVDDWFTGIELHPDVILDNVRVIFRNENGSDVLCVDVVPENIPSDFILRLKYIGCMRSIFWNVRPGQAFARSDANWAAKLRTPNYVMPPLEKLKIIPEPPTLPPSPPPAEKPKIIRRLTPRSSPPPVGKPRITSWPTPQPLSHQQKRRIIHRPPLPQPEKSRLAPTPRRPPPPLSPPLDDDYCEDLDDSPSDNESESSTNYDDNNDEVSREEANRGPVDAGERESVPGNIIGMQTRREQQSLIDRVRRGHNMDGFDHSYLFTFMCAFALALFLRKLILSFSIELVLD